MSKQATDEQVKEIMANVFRSLKQDLEKRGLDPYELGHGAFVLLLRYHGLTKDDVE